LTHPMLPIAERLKDTKDFLGLPVPAAAGMVASLVLVYTSFDVQGLELLMPLLMLAIAILMISNIPYPSFKTIDWHTSTRFRTFILLIFCLGVAFVFKELFFAILFLGYITYGPIRHFIRLSKAKKHIRRQSVQTG